MNDLHTPPADRSARSGPAPWMPPAPPAAPPVRLGRYAVAAVVLVAVAFAAGWFPRVRQRRAVAQTTQQLAVPFVTVVSATPGKSVTPVSLPAEIRPQMEAALYARATGYVRRWTVDLGTSVTNGQVLAELDTPELTQELAQATARVNEAVAAEDLARKTAERWEEMRRIRVVSAQDADEKSSELVLRTAQLESARAEVRRLESLIGFAKVTAPFDGIVTARRLEVGQLVSAGAGTELFHLAQTRTLRVFVRVPQTLAASIAIGQTAEVTFNELPNRQFPARVVRTSGALDPVSRTLLTELELPNPEGTILPGGFAQVRFTDVHPEPVVTLPANTLLFRNDGPKVAIARADSRVELRSVTLGRDLGPSIEILRGVAPTDRVILNPADSISEGAAIQIHSPQAAPGATAH